MSYSNFINKLNTKTDKAIEDTSHLSEEFKKQKALLNLFPKYNDNSIGYKLRYTFELEQELRNNINLTALQIIINFILENEIQNNEMTYFQYSFNFHQGNLRLNMFHSNLNYLEWISENFINIIVTKINQISTKIRNKFIDISGTPLKIKVKQLYREYPLLIDVCCNVLNEKKLLNKVEPIIDGMIKLLFMNDFNISRDAGSKMTTLKSEEDPVAFLTQFSNNENYSYEETTKSSKKRNLEFTENAIERVDKKPLTQSSLFNQMEYFNDNIKQLFWHSLDSPEIKSNKNIWLHTIVFILILSLIYSSVPKYVQKLVNFSKSNSVIDSILDLATEDLTATHTVNKNTITTNKKFSKLDTIEESKEITEEQKPEQVEKKNENEEDLKTITKNIIKHYTGMGGSNLDLNSIENRLKVILEETDTKS